MTNKPYVPHQGIKRTPITTTTTWGMATVTDHAPRNVQGHRAVGTDLKVKGTPVYIDLDAHPEIAAQITAANDKYEQDFVTRYPGIYDLVAARNDADYRYERLQREIESGDGILSNSQPDHDPADVAAQYPIAAAYLTICGYCDSNNLDKYGAGKWAVEQLESGADVIDTCDAMRQRWNAAASAAVANNKSGDAAMTTTNNTAIINGKVRTASGRNARNLPPSESPSNCTGNGS